MKRRIISAILAALTLFALAGCKDTATAEPPNAVPSAPLLTPMSPSVPSVTIGGVEYSTSLTKLFLNIDIAFADIDPLKYMTNLTYLDMENARITNIYMLSGLTNLRYLDLRFNSIANIIPLAGLTNLTYLNLSANPLQDITPLAGLTHLTELDLSGFSNYKRIPSFKPLAALTNLTSLSISGCIDSFSDLSPLINLKNLRFLDLGYFNSNFFDTLKSLPHLTELRLGANGDLSDEQLAELRAALPAGCAISYEYFNTGPE